MGCSGPKSLIELRDQKTFLDITVEQIEYINHKYKTDVPLVLMNSYNTHEETARVIESFKRRYKCKIYCFQQHRYPRISQESLRPTYPSDLNDTSEIWYPPGHGDLYDAFWNSKLFPELLKSGKEIVFVSNIDNLGATIDLKILKKMLNSQDKPCDFAMEVTTKTRADVKGGTLISYRGTMKLLEIMQVPSDHVEDFKSIKKFKIFNTNNIWFNMLTFNKMMRASDFLNLDLIINRKTLSHSRHVIQLETAIGSAIKNFQNSIGIVVPRSRFLPVKNNSDLFLLKSNLYCLSEGRLMMNPSLEETHVTPLVKLVGKSFHNVKEFLQRFRTIPNILELEHLTVSGDVTFGSGVTLKNTVIIIANDGQRIDIPSGSVLDNKIITGSLQILEY